MVSFVTQIRKLEERLNYISERFDTSDTKLEYVSGDLGILQGAVHRIDSKLESDSLVHVNRNTGFIFNSRTQHIAMPA